MLERPVTALSPDEVFDALESSPRGLDPEEAVRRAHEHGPNALPDAARPSIALHLLKQITHMLALLLWGAAALALLARLPELAIAIVAVVVLNAVVSSAQELRAERAMRALASILPRRASVVRGGRIVELDARELVPGDVVRLEEGDAISADARIVGAEGLRVDLSSLTGESLPLERDAEAVGNERVRPTDATNLVLAGTTVTAGRARTVVLRTGARTELGRVAALTGSVRRAPSTLEVSVRRLVRRITVLAVVVGVVTFALAATVTGVSVQEALVFGIGVLVANVPEGLLPTVTLALALGVQRMAKRNVLVRRLSSVETLSAVTTICTDKTGTLTTGSMELAMLWVDGRMVDVPRRVARPIEPDHAELLVTLACVCSNARLVGSPSALGLRTVGDPSEGALMRAAVALGHDPDALRDGNTRTRLVPFDARRRRMAVVVRAKAGSSIAAAADAPALVIVKGAAHEVLARCTHDLGPAGRLPLDAARRAEHEGAHDTLAADGCRVLALALRGVEPGLSDAAPDELERELTFVGLAGLLDPPRADVAEAIVTCREAGVAISMVTGDHSLTALSIARQVGLADEKTRAVTGSELDALDDPELDRLLRDEEPRIFARVLPEQKLRLVRAYQRRGEVVAVTGDGVNDAPALRAADVGIAMGLGGTDVAREAADLVLLDDHFASIVHGIEEGRAIYANVRKFLTYILASNVPEIVPYVVMVAMHVPPALTIAQILAIDLGTDVMPALALAAEPPTPDQMRRGPRAQNAPLFDLGLLGRAYGVLGTTEALVSMAAFFAVLAAAGIGLDSLSRVTSSVLDGTASPTMIALVHEAQTATFLAVVACQVGNLFACRSERALPFARTVLANAWLGWAIAIECGLALALVVVPPLGRAFGMAAPDASHWWLLALGVPALIAADSVYKRVAASLRERVGRARAGSGAHGGV